VEKILNGQMRHCSGAGGNRLAERKTNSVVDIRSSIGLLPATAAAAEAAF